MKKAFSFLRPPDGSNQGAVLVGGWVYPSLQAVIQRPFPVAAVCCRAGLLDPQSFRWLMEGLRIEQKTAIRKEKQKDLF